MSRKNLIILLIFLIISLFSINYSFINNALEEFLSDYEIVFVQRVIDGDTIEIENSTSVRLLGINSPERGEKYYEEAKDFLEKKVLNESVKLEFLGEKKDKYRRLLAYVHLNNENINVEIVENGFANYYFYSGRDKYSDDLLNAWNSCLDKNINLCEKSKNACASCVSINLKSIINNCDFDCDISDWKVKGEGREKFIFSEKILKPNDKENFELDLTDSKGSLFLIDDEERLVLWQIH